MVQKVVFERGNLVADDHPQPVIAKASMSLICSIPDSIAVIADEPGINDILCSDYMQWQFT